MKILVTGGGGFVAGHLLYYLKQDRQWELYAGVLNDREKAQLDRRQAQLASFYAETSPQKPAGEAIGRIADVVMDVTREEAVRDVIRTIRPDRIYHLAAVSSVALSFRDPLLTERINVGGTENLLNAVRDFAPHCRVLLVGSADQYGKVKPQDIPIGEDAPLAPCSPYGASKIAQEKMGLAYKDRYHMDIRLVRSFPHIGPGQSDQFVIANWCAQTARIIRGKDHPAVLTVGNLSAVRDFTDVRDVVRAYYRIMENEGPLQVCNVCSGQGQKLADIPGMLARIAGLDQLKTETDPERLRPSDIPVLIGDNTRIRETCGWQREISFIKSLTDIVDMCKMFPDGS